MKHLSHPYPICTMPKNGEAFVSFLLRLCLENGRISLQDLFSDFSAQVIKSSFLVGSEYYYRVLPYFAKSIGLSGEQLHNLFKEITVYESLESQINHQTNIGNPKFCPHCIVEQGYIKAKWLTIHINHCELHKTKLIQYCPRCNTRPKWSPKLFTSCSNCHLQWSDIELIQTQVPTCERFLETLPKYLYHQYMSALYSNVGKLLRPNDVTHVKYRNLKDQIEDFTEYFEAAHISTVIEQARLDYASHRKRQFEKKLSIPSTRKILNEIDVDLVAVNESTFQQYSRPLEASQKLNIPAEASVKVLTVTRRDHNASNNSCYYLDMPNVKNLLSMSYQCIQHLRRHAILPSRQLENIPTRSAPPPFNDIVNLYKKLFSLVKHKTEYNKNDLISWYSAKRFIKGVTPKHSYIILAALMKDINVYTSDVGKDFLLDELLFDPSELKKICPEIIDSYFEMLNDEPTLQPDHYLSLAS